jgi:hypothetical protein
MAASEVLMLSSLQEGFGLPYLEAASAGRPLIARSLPNIAPDLKRFGFGFPQSYDEIWIDERLFDAVAESIRLEFRFQAWRKTMPASLRPLARLPDWSRRHGGVRAIPFSRLTLDAQLEVLSQPVEKSWSLCAPLNRFLAPWREMAAAGELKPSPWPGKAAHWLSGEAYACGWMRLVRRIPDGGARPGASAAAQMDFIRSKLAPGNQYPLLWSVEA